MNEAHFEKGDDGRLRLAGVLGFDTVSGVLEQSRALFDGLAEIAIDLCGVERADSAGLALLVEWMRDARRRNCAIRFLNMPTQMLAIARVSSLDHILPLGRG